jgi:predicted RNA-binding Zn-ribbon protein involved in translation (DUF1610 family)
LANKNRCAGCNLLIYRDVEAFEELDERTIIHDECLDFDLKQMSEHTCRRCNVIWRCPNIKCNDQYHDLMCPECLVKGFEIIEKFREENK